MLETLETPAIPTGRGRIIHRNRTAERWLNLELVITIAMLTLSFGTLITLLNWPTKLAGMNYMFIIIPYLSLTGALFAAQIIRRRIQRKEIL